jgi:hypothetical protein
MWADDERLWHWCCGSKHESFSKLLSVKVPRYFLSTVGNVH